jgi:hypothetical protein
MSLRKLFKPTKIKLLFTIGLFLFFGFIKIFTLESFLTGEIYKVSLFNQYKFYFQHLSDGWYSKGDKSFWPYIISLHAFTSYILVCVSAFIVNRLHGRD